MQKELVQISRDRLASMKPALQSTSDNAIMSANLNTMDDESRAYYQKKRRAIIACELQEEKEREEKEKKQKEEKDKKEKEEKEKKEKERKEKEEKQRKDKEAIEIDGKDEDKDNDSGTDKDKSGEDNSEAGDD
ncbi:hypothetical protein PGT21_018263 [Puccinia graminis f. sp. tritici]|uniref:No apical meristem-associated C-terminal domain-containing protein n=1 Tax=Puccinia graminis f. sp. tritici TaxID=56615 RepID=A0A5B0Q3F1_PUCGR|nr:hypothetical protein PGT21_018263 [Puccinia graminis f. sp. tritici]